MDEKEEEEEFCCKPLLADEIFVQDSRSHDHIHFALELVYTKSKINRNNFDINYFINSENFLRTS